MSAIPAPHGPPSPIPEHPHRVPLTQPRWEAVAARWFAGQPPIGELSFWSHDLWRGGPDIDVSRIGPILVVEFTDVPGQAMVLVSSEAELDPPTIRRLITFVGCHDVRFVTEPTAAALRAPLAAAGYALVAERDNADYHYRLADLAGYRGLGLRGKLRQVRRFTNRNPSHAFGEGRLDDDRAYERVLSVATRWRAAKHPDAVPAAVALEFAGVHGWRRGDGASEVRVFWLEVSGEPVAVSVVQPLWDGVFLGVFFKADPSVAYATATLREHVASVLEPLAPHGTFNAMQDDGVPSLRASKLSYHPVRLEPKYAVVRAVPSISVSEAS